MASSGFLRSPLYHFPLPSSSRSRNAHTNTNFRGTGAPMPCLRREEAASCNKRTVLSIGTSFLPLRGLRVKALEGLARKESKVKTLEYSQNHEIVPQKGRSPCPFLSLLNDGTLSSIVVGALYGYVVAQKEKADAKEEVETMYRKVNEGEVMISLMKTRLPAMILNRQNEQIKQLARAKDEQDALINQLNSANSAIDAIEQELQNKENLIEQLKLQIDSLGTQLAKANAEKKDVEKSLEEKIDSVKILEEKFNLMSLELQDKKDFVQNLTSSMAEKEFEIRSLNSYYEQTKDELSNCHFQIQGLMYELLKSQEELRAKESSVDDLDASVKLLSLENNYIRREFYAMEENYHDLMFSISTDDEKTALDAKLLREKEEELRQLKEKFEHALNEASRNQVIIVELTQERENLKDSLENEYKKANHLESELQITLENLGKSRNETAQLKRLTNESHKRHKELEVEASELSAELLKAREALQRSIYDEKHSVEMLTNELRIAKEDSKKTQVELESTSREMTAAMEDCSSLQRELVDAYKKAETAAKDLKEEKMLVASLNKDVQALERQVFQEQETRRAREMKLEEAAGLLDEMKQQELILTGYIKRFNSRILNLEDDKVVLHKLLTDQDNASNQTQENFEDAQDHIKRLGMEIENLESKAKKLEEELSSANGEISRLRSQNISSSEVFTTEQLQNVTHEEGELPTM